MFDGRLKINFSATKKFDEIDYYFKSMVRKAIKTTLSYEDFPYDAEVSVTFTTPEYIRELNKEYRDKDKATDVLSFPLYEDFEEEADILEEEGCVLGDIVISMERAAEQAREVGNTLIEEVCFLAIHSTLHLLGYDHELSKEDDEAQCLAQREIVQILDI